MAEWIWPKTFSALGYLIVVLSSKNELSGRLLTPKVKDLVILASA